MLGGGYAEIVDSGGSGLIVQVDGADLDAHLIARRAMGMGVGVDVGAAGVTHDGRTTVGASLLNALDYLSWGIASRQDCVFVAAHDLLVTELLDPRARQIEEVLDNEDLDGDGEVDFTTRLPEEGFSRSLPALLRLGVAHQQTARLSLLGAYDQAFSSGFGVTTTPRLAVGAEYCLVPWFPVRFGLSMGGRWHRSAAVGMALGPFALGRLSVTAVDVALATRGGLFPNVAKGTALSARFLEIVLR